MPFVTLTNKWYNDRPIFSSSGLKFTVSMTVAVSLHAATSMSQPSKQQYEPNGNTQSSKKSCRRPLKVGTFDTPRW